ncbi:unnamed protein product, partial [Trypanosoma congolense IL3000]
MIKLFMVMMIMVVMGSWVREWRVMANGEHSVNEKDNSEYFSLLCKIYNVANHPPIKPVNTKEYQKIVEDIDALSAAANGKESVNTQTEETKSAQTQLIGITQEAHKLLDEIKKENPEGEVEKVKNTFNTVIFGEHGNAGDLYHGALRGVESNRPKACGSKEKKGDSAGKNLVVDFFCLCAQPNDVSEGVDKVCGVSVGSGDSAGWGGKLDSPGTMWNEVKKGCEKYIQQSLSSTQGGHFLYREFLDKVMAGGNVKVKNLENVPKRGMLGTAVENTVKRSFN